jgi:hypothetical protein
MSTTAKRAFDRQEDSPAQVILESFLDEALRTEVPSSDNPAGIQREIDLRTDILYVLTDKIAYRRALPLTRLMEEVRGLQISELAGSPLTNERITASLHVLLQQRLVREFEAPAEKHYELAHDFLVRYVVRTYRGLERRRISQLAILKQQQQATGAELARLSKLSSAVSWILRSLPIVTFGLAIGLFIYAVNRTLPVLFGLSYLWILALPSAALLLLGIAARRLAAISLAVIVLVSCAGTWFSEYSQPLVDAGKAIFNGQAFLEASHQTDWCYQFGISAASIQLYSHIDTFLNPCYQARPWADDINIRNMIWNAGGLQGNHPLTSDANFCYDVSQVFTKMSPVDHDSLMRACWQHTPDWSLYLARAQESSYFPHTGVLIHSYQAGDLSSWVGWIAICLLIGHILLYPAVLLSTVQNVAVSNALRRISGEILDVVLILTTLIGIDALIINFSSNNVGPIEGLVVIPLLHAIVYMAVSAVLLIRKRSSIGMLLMQMRLTDRAGSSVISTGKLISRALLLWIWSVLNLLFGAATLVVAPLYIWLRKDHQLLYDSLLKLRTEPKYSVERSDATAIIPTAMPANTTSTTAARV